MPGQITPTREQVLVDLGRILDEVVGEDLLMGEPLAMETSFNEDLQLESIEFVALAEALLETYGSRVDFVSWMAAMELDDVVALTAGDVVDFVVESLQPAGV
ncbi:MAG: hypothetical protein LT071_14740 [Nocardioides sp.]|nr:hypothetical protein [Nocardioides sp.]